MKILNRNIGLRCIILLVASLTLVVLAILQFNNVLFHTTPHYRAILSFVVVLLLPGFLLLRVLRIETDFWIEDLAFSLLASIFILYMEAVIGAILNLSLVTVLYFHFFLVFAGAAYCCFRSGKSPPIDWKKPIRLTQNQTIEKIAALVVFVLIAKVSLEYSKTGPIIIGDTLFHLAKISHYMTFPELGSKGAYCFQSPASQVYLYSGYHLVFAFVGRLANLSPMMVWYFSTKTIVLLFFLAVCALGHQVFSRRVGIAIVFVLFVFANYFKILSYATTRPYGNQMYYFFLSPIVLAVLLKALNAKGRPTLILATMCAFAYITFHLEGMFFFVVYCGVLLFFIGVYTTKETKQLKRYLTLLGMITLASLPYVIMLYMSRTAPPSDAQQSAAEAGAGYLNRLGITPLRYVFSKEFVLSLIGVTILGFFVKKSNSAKIIVSCFFFLVLVNMVPLLMPIFLQITPKELLIRYNYKFFDYLICFTLFIFIPLFYTKIIELTDIKKKIPKYLKFIPYVAALAIWYWFLNKIFNNTLSSFDGFVASHLRAILPSFVVFGFVAYLLGTNDRYSISLDKALPKNVMSSLLLVTICSLSLYPRITESHKATQSHISKKRIRNPFTAWNEYKIPINPQTGVFRILEVLAADAPPWTVTVTTSDDTIRNMIPIVAQQYVLYNKYRPNPRFAQRLERKEAHYQIFKGNVAQILDISQQYNISYIIEHKGLGYRLWAHPDKFEMLYEDRKNALYKVHSQAPDPASIDSAEAMLRRIDQSIKSANSGQSPRMPLIQFGSIFSLYGYRLEKNSYLPGEQLHFFVEWEIKSKPTRDYAIGFVIETEKHTFKHKSEIPFFDDSVKGDDIRPGTLIEQEFALRLPKFLSDDICSIELYVIDQQTGKRVRPKSDDDTFLKNNNYVMDLFFIAKKPIEETPHIQRKFALKALDILSRGKITDYCWGWNILNKLAKIEGGSEDYANLVESTRMVRNVDDPKPRFLVNTIFDDTVELYGYSPEIEQFAGKRFLILQIFWKMKRKAHVMYILKTSLLRQDDNTFKVDLDHSLLRRASSFFRHGKGEVIKESLIVPIDNRFAPGVYTVKIDLYNKSTKQLTKKTGSKNTNVFTFSVLQNGIVRIDGM